MFEKLKSRINLRRMRRHRRKVELEEIRRYGGIIGHNPLAEYMYDKKLKEDVGEQYYNMIRNNMFVIEVRS